MMFGYRTKSFLCWVGRPAGNSAALRRVEILACQV